MKAKILTSTLLLLATQLAATAEPQETHEQAPIFVDSISVDVVNIDVVVRDRKGQLVLGLTREDFEVFVDGKPIEISNFLAASQDRPVAAATVGNTGDELEGTLPETQQLNLLVFVDDSALHMSGRKEAFAALRGFLTDRQNSGQRIMLVRYAGSVKVHSQFSDDLAAVMDGIETIESMVPGGMMQTAQWSKIIRDIEAGAFGGDQDILQTIRTYARDLHHTCKVKIALMRSFIDTLSGLKGRKAMVYVSDGIPMNPGESLFALYLGGAGAAMAEAQRFSLHRELGGLVDHANAARVTFYTINTGGWVAHNVHSRAMAITASPMIDMNMCNVADSNHSGSLNLLASDTGGMSSRRASIEAFQQVADDLDSFYSLGITPDNPSDVNQHKVKVKVNQKGLSLRYRRGFGIISHDERLANQTVAVLVTEPVDNPLQMSLEIDDSAKRKGKNFLISLAVRVPTAQLAFVQEGTNWNANVIVHVICQGPKGRTIDPVRYTPSLSIPDEVFKAGAVPEIVWHVELKVREGRHKLAVSVSDEIAGLDSSLSKEVIIDKIGVVSTISKSESEMSDEDQR